MPKLVPTHTVMLKRDHPQGHKDDKGNVRQVSVQPRIGEPFDFTDEEVEHVNAHRDTGLRPPVNEGGDNQSQALRDQANEAAQKAADLAAKTGTAQNDAAVTARAAAVAKQGKKPARDPEISRQSLLGQAQEEEDEDL